MKKSFFVFVAWVTLGMCLYCSAQDKLDMNQVMRDPFTAFIIHSTCPAENILSNRYDNVRLTPDIKELDANLHRLLRPAFLPAADDLKNVIGITNFMADVKVLPDSIRCNDYLMLRYNTKAQIPVMIQDGRDLYVMVKCPDAQRGLYITPTNFISAMASMVLNYPEDKSGATNQIEVFVSTITLGNSRLGFIYWGQKTRESAEWYDMVSWWSDGNQVLFGLSKLTHEEILESRRYSKPWLFFKPRQFQDRKGGASQHSAQLTEPANIVAHPKEPVLSDAMEKRKCCILNLRIIDALKDQWALEKGKTNGALVINAEIDAYDKTKMPPVCPTGGTYTYNPVGVLPVCSFSTTNSDGKIIRHRLGEPN